MPKIFSGIWGPLSIILTGLGLISTIQTFWEVEVISTPEIILESYRKLRDVFFNYAIEWWFPYKFPSELKDIICLYFFCSTTVYNYYRWVGTLDKYGRLRVFLAGPLLLGMGIYMGLDEEERKRNPQFVLFYWGHILATVLFGSVAAIFFIWNTFLINNL